MWLDDYHSELYHHGILGQKWGKKNGPPYPLGTSDHSSSEKKAGWRKSLDKQSKANYTKDSSAESSEKKSHTDKQKKYIKIGAAVVAAALVTYGTYKLKQSGRLDPLIDKGRDAVNQLLGKNKIGGEFGDFSSGKVLVNSYGDKIKTLTNPEALSDTLRKVNPLRSSDAGRNNCTYCALASFLRQSDSHLDVIARSTGGQPQYLASILRDSFKKVDIITDPTECFGNTKEEAAKNLIKQFGNNASGVLGVGLKNRSGGHAFNWEIKDGIVSFFDGQKGFGNNIVSKYFDIIDLSKDFVLARLDNCEVDLDGITTYVK